MPAVREAAAEAGVTLAVRGLLPGILVDAVALRAGGWEAATLSRGTVGTLTRIHSPRDHRDTLTGHGIAQAAEVMAGAARRLASPAGVDAADAARAR